MVVVLEDGRVFHVVRTDGESVQLCLSGAELAQLVPHWRTEDDLERHLKRTGLTVQTKTLRRSEERHIFDEFAA